LPAKPGAYYTRMGVNDKPSPYNIQLQGRQEAWRNMAQYGGI